MAPVHPRMPVILTEECMWDWLTAKTETEKLALLKPLEPELMQAWPVGREVNSPAIDDESLIHPIDAMNQSIKQEQLL